MSTKDSLTASLGMTRNIHSKDSPTAPYVAGNDTKKMDALQKISTSKTKFNFAAGIKPGSTIIIGLSGGPDSVYLLHTLISVKESLGLSLIAAHLDHEWRESSKEDVAFCKNLCAQLDIPFITKKGSELLKSFKSNGSQEQLGRSMRRFFLEQTRQEYNAQFIALAHHQDDQLETFFINFIRGTTITGLCGMKLEEGFFIRPLLFMTKQKILSYLSENKIPYQIDPTNESDAYLRNRIRANVMPALVFCDARAKTNLVRAMHNIQDTEQFLKKITEQALREVIHTKSPDSASSSSSLTLVHFFKLDPYLQKRVLYSWLSATSNGTCRSSEAFLDEALRFLTSPRGGSHQISPSLKLVKKKMTASIAHITNKSTL